MKEGSFAVDTANWPIVIHTMTGNLTDAQVDGYIAEATPVLQRSEPHFAVMDSTGLASPSAYMRSRCMAWEREHRHLLREKCLGAAFVLSSPVVRFIAMTVKLVTRLPMPYTICATREEALQWVALEAARRTARLASVRPPRQSGDEAQAGQ